MIQENLSSLNMNDASPILAIETSDRICGACIYFNEVKYFSAKILLKHSHSEKLFELINSVITQAGIGINEVKLISVSAGPGSFTGLRIGMAAAKGIAEPLKIPIMPVPTFRALALQISEYMEPDSSFIIVNKVGKDELYFGKFQIKSNNHIFQNELKIIPNTDFIKLTEGLPVFGSVNYQDGPDALKIKNITSPDPEYVARWASLNYPDHLVEDFDFLEPSYLKEFIVKEKKL